MEKVITIFKLVPTEFEECEVAIPTDYIEFEDKIVPIDYVIEHKIIPTDYMILRREMIQTDLRLD